MYSYSVNIWLVYYMFFSFAFFFFFVEVSNEKEIRLACKSVEKEKTEKKRIKWGSVGLSLTAATIVMLKGSCRDLNKSHFLVLPEVVTDDDDEKKNARVIFELRGFNRSEKTNMCTEIFWKKQRTFWTN